MSGFHSSAGVLNFDLPQGSVLSPVAHVLPSSLFCTPDAATQAHIHLFPSVSCSPGASPGYQVPWSGMKPWSGRPPLPWPASLSMWSVKPFLPSSQLAPGFPLLSLPPSDLLFGPWLIRLFQTRLSVSSSKQDHLSIPSGWIHFWTCLETPHPILCQPLGNDPRTGHTKSPKKGKLFFSYIQTRNGASSALSHTLLNLQTSSSINSTS